MKKLKRLTNVPIGHSIKDDKRSTDTLKVTVVEPTDDVDGFLGGYEASYGKVSRMIYKIDNIR